MSEMIDKNLPLLNWMQTYSGHKFQPFDPKPDQICIEDIAHALGMNCRYNGHVKRFYSVAEHSVYVSKIVPPECALWGLLHDGAEAYISDLPKPFKDGIAEYYNPHEQRILEVIAEKFGISMPYSPTVKKADWAALVVERYQAVPHQEHEWPSIIQYGELFGFDSLPDFEIEFWGPVTAKHKFLTRFRELTKGSGFL